MRGAKFLWRNKKKRPAKSHWASALPSPTEGHLLWLRYLPALHMLILILAVWNIILLPPAPAHTLSLLLSSLLIYWFSSSPGNFTDFCSVTLLLTVKTVAKIYDFKILFLTLARLSLACPTFLLWKNLWGDVTEWSAPVLSANEYALQAKSRLSWCF